jgi:hypothetical protein
MGIAHKIAHKTEALKTAARNWSAEPPEPPGSRPRCATEPEEPS